MSHDMDRLRNEALKVAGNVLDILAHSERILEGDQKSLLNDIDRDQLPFAAEASQLIRSLEQLTVKRAEKQENYHLNSYKITYWLKELNSRTHQFTIMMTYSWLRP